MDKLLGDSIIIVYFVAAFGVICYENFIVSQKIMILYAITYLSCLLNVLDSKVAMVAISVFAFIYFEYLTDDHGKLKIVKKIKYKIIDTIFLLFFQYYYWIFCLAVIMQTQLIQDVYAYSWWRMVCKSASIVLFFACIHATSVQKFEISTISKMMCIIEKYPVYNFPHKEIDHVLYDILVQIEDRSYFLRPTTYNFLSLEFVKYRVRRFKAYLYQKKWWDKIRNTIQVVGYYAVRTKHIRGYSTLEMQLIRNIGIENGYNCVIRRKIFEFVYTTIFFSSLKDYFLDNYYSNREHYKEYLLWLYFKCVNCRINGKDVRPVTEAFDSKDMENWSPEAVFIVCMGLSHKTLEWYYYDPYYTVIEMYGLDMERICEMYHGYGENRLA